MSTVFTRLLLLYLFLMVGYLLGKKNAGQAAQSGVLSYLTVNLLLPAKIFRSFSQNFTLPYIRTHVISLGVSCGLLVVLSVLAWLLARKMAKKSFERNVYRYTFTVSNYSYLGYTLTETLFGAEALTDLILFCFPFAIYTYTFGYALLTGTRVSAKRLLTPLTVSLFLGAAVGLSGVTFPTVANDFLDMAAACVGPITMLLTGLTLSEGRLRDLLADGKTYLVTAIRLVGIPLITFLTVGGLCYAELLPLSVFRCAMLMACMPCGLNPVIFPKLVGEDCRIGARHALVSHVVSMITVPLWISIFV